jgi:uncharacterized protein (TIGR02284 family)
MSTTPTHHAKPHDVIYVLNKCIEICTDGQKGYEVAAADARDATLKAFLHQKSEERAAFVVALQAAIQKMGAFPESQGTAKGTVHRGWMDVRLALEGHQDRFIVQEWARGEQAALDGYQKALSRAPLDTLPPDIRKMLQSQYAAIRAGVEAARRHVAGLQ